MKTKSDNPNINWWNIELGESEIQQVTAAIQDRHISQGVLTEQFEQQLAEFLSVPYAVCTTSGTVSLLMAFLALGIHPGDEVIMPNRTYVATANAALLLGGNVRLVDVLPDSPLMDTQLIEEKINEHTKAIVAVHLNGHAADMDPIHTIAAKHGLQVIEDACQAFGSRWENRYLGTFSRFGCFSLGMAKLFTTGQGGFLVCHTEEDHLLLQRIRNQGLSGCSDKDGYDILAGNFKFTDIQAALGMSQLNRIEKRIQRQKEIYTRYREGLSHISFLRCVEVDIQQGEVPLRAEYLCTERDAFIRTMHDKGITVLPHIAGLNESAHLNNSGSFPRTELYNRHLVILPCGPDQPMEHIDRTIEVITLLAHQFSSWS